VRHNQSEKREAEEATGHPPGSDEKIRVLSLRVKYDLPLKVKGDADIPVHPHNKRFNPKYEEPIDEEDTDDI
tara:strand:+ start:1690 stop:1905 length:216 start_codon:yes stop_codon:yes gene_type:complete